MFPCAIAGRVKVPVQLFHAQYRDALDEVFHLIGIRESGEHTEPVPQPRHLNVPPPLSASSRLPSSLRNTSSENSISVNSSVIHDAAPLPLAQPSEYEPNEVAVWVDLLHNHNHLPVLRCSPAFFSMFGSTTLRRGSKLLSWVEEDARPHFSEHMQVCLDALMKDETARSPRPLGRVKLSHPHMDFKTNMCISLPPQDMDEMVGKISCHNIESRARKPFARGHRRTRQEPASESTRVCL
mmetsp:Transcript_98415/g.254483  ORF Transcript_98415/g.254483 Transcript_98415/m.254483 type:complete len:239 (+) Transcript_98415:991-1707(+)